MMRLKVTKGILWFFVGVAATVAAFRLLKGLGFSTALTDTTPWGLWIGFDVMGGVALAAGGFVMAAVVYIFHMEKYHPIVRPAVLTAFLGYVAVAVGLSFDVGLPWNLWRPMFFWQHHSALFEVAMCVMSYLTVLALEFAPVVFERLPFKRIYKLLKAATLPLVILGIMLSTLHQSSLGTLLLIMPFRIHPMWYSTLLPAFFFISAIGLGLTMVITESMVTSWLYERKPETHLLAGLARAASYVLGLYAVLKIGDLAWSGKLHFLVDGSWEANLFIFELLISAILPAVLFAIPKVRQSATGLLIGALSAVFGFVLNRISVSGLATISATGTRYFPSWMEFAISIGIVSGAALIFFFLVENFSVYEEEHEEVEEKGDIITIESPTTIKFHLPPFQNAWMHAIVFIVGAGVSFALMFDVAVYGLTPEKTPVEKARPTHAFKTTWGDTLHNAYELYDPLEADEAVKGELVEVLMIDGDRKNRFVLFNHEEHKELVGGGASCAICHHMSTEVGEIRPCHECHSDMFLTTDFTDSLGDTLSASSYMDAMHSVCITCHAKVDESMGRCRTCHSGTSDTLTTNRDVFAILDGNS